MASLAQESADQFCNHPLWQEAYWLATTYQFHPLSEAPPIVGFVFADIDKGVQLFRTWIDDWGNVDGEDEIRLAIIEGDVPGLEHGYSIHLSATELITGQGTWQRMYPEVDTPNMLQHFLSEYEIHQEFMIAPVILTEDEMPQIDVERGIIKRKLHRRVASEIVQGDVDYVAIVEASGN